MVPPEGVCSIDEREGDYETRSQAAAAVRRSNTKITKPLPEPITWVEGVPDACSQHQLDSHIVSLEAENEKKERAEEQAHGLAVSTNDDHRRESSSHPHHQGSSQVTLDEAHSQVLSTPVDPRLNQRDSTIGSSPLSQMDAKKKRRSATIRTVLRKVFGRKEKTQSKPLSPIPGPSPKHEHSRSEPIPSTPTKFESIRSHEEVRKQHPLRSQPSRDYPSRPVMTPPVLPFPMNINAPDPSASPSNYLSFETEPRVHRRRATLPSIVLSPDDAALLRTMWSSSELHPISSSTRNQGQSLSSPNIGLAVTSGKLENPKRRSRSSSALRELSTAQGQDTGSRRRSSEIRYWRTSHMMMQRFENDRRVSTISDRECRIDDSTIVASAHGSTSEVSDAFAKTDSSFRADNVNAFDFGSKAMEPSSIDKHASVVEARLSHLEFNMQHLSLSLQEATQQKTLQPFVIDQAPIQRRSHSSLNSSRNEPMLEFKDAVPRKRNKSPDQHAQTSSTSVAPSSQSPASLYLPFSGRFSPLDPDVISRGPAQTIQPSMSQAVHQAHAASLEEVVPSPLLYDQLAPLYNALRYERTIRKELETQVQQLRREVFELSKSVARLRGDEGLPTPSPEATLPNEIQQRNEGNKFSGDDSDDEGKAHAEKWATPREEKSPRPWGRTSPDGEMF
ncbi:hypothetical protein FKW77_003150 [Venturia effusa]|uniref:Uncharacterized protein n=1 Tax=Venturia effusa TaxID=50376 RepID=A0A517LJX2_9PEZI|nr:hypothetical protein FKW77_003150 [Venturia effusa]